MQRENKKLHASIAAAQKERQQVRQQLKQTHDAVQRAQQLIDAKKEKVEQTLKQRKHRYHCCVLLYQRLILALSHHTSSFFLRLSSRCKKQSQAEP